VTLPELHLAGEAIAALVDGELSRHAESRALDHTARCPECRLAVTAQRQAKAALIAATVPALSCALLSRLHDVPMTTDLSKELPGGPGGGTLAVSDRGEELLWAPLTAAPAVAPVRSAAPGPRRPRGHRRQRASRPSSYPTAGRAHSTRLRRGLAGTLAGLAFGVVAAAVPIGAVGTVSEPNNPGVVNRGPQVVPAGVGVGLTVPGRQRDTTTVTTRLGGSTGETSQPVRTVVRGVTVAK
jgi:hypothetical protein